jgi:hypothetical protein
LSARGRCATNDRTLAQRRWFRLRAVGRSASNASPGCRPTSSTAGVEARGYEPERAIGPRQRDGRFWPAPRSPRRPSRERGARSRQKIVSAETHRIPRGRTLYFSTPSDNATGPSVNPALRTHRFLSSVPPTGLGYGMPLRAAPLSRVHRHPVGRRGFLRAAVFALQAAELAKLIKAILVRSGGTQARLTDEPFVGLRAMTEREADLGGDIIRADDAECEHSFSTRMHWYSASRDRP